MLTELARKFLPDLGAQGQSDVTAMAFMISNFSKRELPLPLELAADLAVEGLLVGLDGQEYVGPLGDAPA
jgi:hypothetical protein